MQYRSHRIGGAAAGAVGAAALIGVAWNGETFGLSALLIGCSVIGSLLPDIDHPNSKASKSNPILAALVNLFLVTGRAITQAILLLCFWMSKKRKEQILKGFEHRGIFHTLLMTVLLYLLLTLIPGKIGRVIQIGMTFGYASHLLMDMLTVSGVKLLYPVVTKSFHWPFIRLHTGNIIHEWIARIIFIILALLLLYYGRDFWRIIKF